MDHAPSIDALAAAYLTGEGLTQGEIAAKLNKTQSTISRLVAEAEAAGHLSRKPLWQPGNLDEAVLRAVRARAGRQRLATALETLRRSRMPSLRLPKVAVFPSGSRGTTYQEYKDRLRRFGAEAAGELLQLLSHSKICGVAWGKTLAATVQAARGEIGRVQPKRRPEVFIPVCGEQVGIHPPKASASVLAASLAEIWSGNRTAAKSLLGVPAFVPSQLGRDSQAVWKYIRAIHSYREIFGSDPGRPTPDLLIERMDTLLVSVGASGVALGLGYGEQFRELAGIDSQRLSELVDSDIGGALIPKATLTRADWTELTQVSARWTGIKLPQIERCAEAARKDPRLPGVVLIAIGANKAEAVRRVLVEHQLVNHLICDDDLEDELVRLLGASAEPPRAA